jgi:carbamoyl-phosphate synthase large subunit
LLDHFLNAAIEVDIDAISDGKDVVIGSIMQHIEQAGVHSGDSACSLPPYTLSQQVQDEMKEVVKAMGLELGVVGLMNVQLAYQDGLIYVIEVNPRASRTVPFVSKAIGTSLAKVAAQVMAGKTLAEVGFTEEVVPKHFSVKESVFPFNKFPSVDPILGPEMKSTGEVMGIGDTFDEAFAKGVLAAGGSLPTGGKAFLSVREVDKDGIVDVARQLADLGFSLVATSGTARALNQAGLEVESINKVQEGRPHIVDSIKNGDIDLIVNTTEGRSAIADSAQIRQSALQKKIAYSTTLAGGDALARAIRFGPEKNVRRLQNLH